MDIVIACHYCKDTTTVRGITDDQWFRYINGEMVQNVWPERSENEREAIIGFRAGFHSCPTCWDELFAEEDDA